MYWPCADSVGERFRENECAGRGLVRASGRLRSALNQAAVSGRFLVSLARAPHPLTARKKFSVGAADSHPVTKQERGWTGRGAVAGAN